MRARDPLSSSYPLTKRRNNALPHVVLKGEFGGIPLWEILHPLVEESEEWLIKVEEVYV